MLFKKKSQYLYFIDISSLSSCKSLQKSHQKFKDFNKKEVFFLSLSFSNSWRKLMYRKAVCTHNTYKRLIFSYIFWVFLFFKFNSPSKTEKRAFSLWDKINIQQIRFPLCNNGCVIPLVKESISIYRFQFNKLQRFKSKLKIHKNLEILIFCLNITKFIIKAANRAPRTSN